MSHDPVKNNTPVFPLTLFTNNNARSLSKTITLGPDGVPISTAAAWMTAGTAEHVNAEGLAGVARLIESCASSQAFALGVIHKLWRPSAGGSVKVVTKKTLREKPDENAGAIARSGEFLACEEGVIGLFPGDHDRKGITQNVETLLGFSGGVIGALHEVFPQLKHAGRIVRASTSAGLYNPVTGEDYPGSAGLHIYIPVYDASDNVRALKAACQRLVLARFGWIFIDKAGRMHVRCILDAAVGKAERLFFEGPPVLTPPLGQDEDARRCEVVEGDIIDTREVFPDLSAAELREYNAIVAHLKGLSADKAASIRKEDDERVAQEIVKKQKVDIKDARARVALRHHGQLAPEMVIDFDDPEIGAKTVAEIIAEPDRYLGETAADPLAGVEYGRCKSMVMRDAHEGYLFLNSFAHGGAVYRLLPGYSELEKTLHAAAFDRVAEVYAALIADAGDILSATEKTKLRALAKERAGSHIRITDLDRAVASEHKKRDARRRAEAMAEARRGDPRVRLPAPAKDQEVTPLALAVDNALSKATGFDKPLRNRQGELVVFAEMKLRALRSASEITDGVDMPPATMLTMRSATMTQTGLLIERFVALEDAKGLCRSPEDKLCRAINALPWGQTGIPACAGFQQLPLVLPDGACKSGRGYDPATQLMFCVPKELDDLLAGRHSSSVKYARRAYRFLTEDWLGDVLTDAFGKAALIASCLTIIERHLLDERICAAISAVQAKTGKTTVIRMLCAAVLGEGAPARSWAEDEVERQKMIFAVALEGAAIVVFDNVPEFGKLDSAALCAALTCPTVANRVLGASKTAQAESRFVPIFTGNSIRPVGDLASRCLLVKMVANSSQPENREFRHDFPVEWTLQNRAKILAALYVLLLVEREARRPRSRFKMWDQLIAHPLHVVSGIDLTEGFGENEQLDEEKLRTAAKLALLHKSFSGQEFTTKALHDRLCAANPNETDKQLLAAFRNGGALLNTQALGHALRKLENLHLSLGASEYCLKSRKDAHAKMRFYKLEALAHGGAITVEDEIGDILALITDDASPF